MLRGGGVVVGGVVYVMGWGVRCGGAGVCCGGGGVRWEGLCACCGGGGARWEGLLCACHVGRGAAEGLCAQYTPMSVHLWRTSPSFLGKCGKHDTGSLQGP